MRLRVGKIEDAGGWRRTWRLQTKRVRWPQARSAATKSAATCSSAPRRARAHCSRRTATARASVGTPPSGRRTSDTASHSSSPGALASAMAPSPAPSRTTVNAAANAAHALPSVESLGCTLRSASWRDCGRTCSAAACTAPLSAAASRRRPRDTSTSAEARCARRRNCACERFAASARFFASADASVEAATSPAPSSTCTVSPCVAPHVGVWCSDRQHLLHTQVVMRSEHDRVAAGARGEGSRACGRGPHLPERGCSFVLPV